MFEFGTFIVSILGFLILFLLIKKWGFEPLANMMEKRRLYVETQLSEAEQEKEQAKKILDEQEEMLETARRQARELVDHARIRAEEQAHEIVELAEAEAQRILEQGRELVDRERSEAMSAVLATVSALTVQISEKLLKDHSTPALHADMMREAEKRLGELAC